MMDFRRSVFLAFGGILCGIVLAGASFAAGPVEELYSEHLTILSDFDAGTTDSMRFNDLKSMGKDWLVGDGGLFGTKGLVAGHFGFGNVKGRNGRPVVDMVRPGTVLFWIKLNEDVDPAMKYDPAATHFSAMWSGKKRFLVFRQDGKSMGASGAAPLSAFFHTVTPSGKAYQVRSNAGPSYRQWKKGEWHLVAATWRPDGVGISYDGAPFKNVVSTERLGPGVRHVDFQTYGSKGESAGSCVMDDCAILDFALSDNQIRELWDEYQARMNETHDARGEVRVDLVKCGEKDEGAYEIILEVKNRSGNPVSLCYTATAKPLNSQPAERHEVFVLDVGAEKTLRLTGPALGEEPVTADFSIVSKDGQKTYYRRHRVFAPHAQEPEWMRSPSAVSFKFAYYPYANAIHALVDVTGCEDMTKVRSFKLSLCRKGEVASEAESVFRSDPSGCTEVQWRGLPELDGEYVCRLTCDDTEEVKAEQEFLRKRFDWEHNVIGLSDALPSPFTPVVREKEGSGPGMEHVKVLLRDHTIGELDLWAQVNAAGKDILARPISLVEPKTMRRYDVSQLSASAAWDVDGLMEWKLKLGPGHYEPMSLEIPLKSSVAWLYHACGDGLRSNPAGRIPAGTGRVWDSRKVPRNCIIGTYAPYLWIGGTLRGISVFGENDRGWVTDGQTPCAEIAREGETVKLILNLIQRPVDVHAPREIRLGFMATPIKPMREGWRNKPHGVLLGSCWCWGAERSCCAVEPYDGSDEFFHQMGAARKSGRLNEEYLKKAVEEFPYEVQPGTESYARMRKKIFDHFRFGLVHAQNAKATGRLTFYTNARGVQYGDPKGQGRTFCNEWNRFEYFTRNIVRATERAYDLDPVESYRDYAAYWYARMIDSGACDFMYWDDVYPSGNFNIVQTDAYRRPDGQIQPSMGIFNMRALVKRCAVIQSERGKDTTGNWVHMTNTAMAPICSFAGVNYDWEDSSGDEPMQVKYPKDYILACTIGRQFGNRVGIMGYFHPKSKERGEWLHRTGAGVMLTHELRWNLWSGHKDWEKYHGLLCEWGYRTPEVSVWNYWDEDVEYPIVVSGVENASIVMAKKATGEAYVCVSSFSSDDGAVMIMPDAAKLGLRQNWRVTDAESGEEIDRVKGVFKLDIEHYNWRLVKLH